MALLGMGANVQCNGYVPGYHSTRDRIFGTEGSTWTSSNGNIELQSDHYNKGSLPVSSPVHLLEYNKELLKQTILRHDAILRDQIHELHRLYFRQRELMDEIKRNELDKHNLRLETSWSSSFQSHLSSKNAERIYCLPNLPWSTGQSSAIVTESIQLPLGSGQENRRQKYYAPAPSPSLIPTDGYSKDSEPSASKYRKVGNKLLDLHLPADEYIDSEEGGSLEDDKFSKVPGVSAYTLKGVSQAVYNSDKQPYGANSKGFTDLNEQFKLEAERAVKSDDLMGPTSHRKNLFHHLSMRRELHSHNLPNDVFWNPYKRQDHEVCSDNLPSKQEKKQELLSIMIRADQINQGPWSGRKFSGGENSAGPQGPTHTGLLGPSCDLYRPVTETDMISSKISPLASLKTPVSDTGKSQTAVPAQPYFSASALFNQSSKVLMGMPGLTGDEFYGCQNIKSGPSLDGQNILLSSFGCGSKTLDPPSIITNSLNSFVSQSSSTSLELKKCVKGFEDVETSNNINLNVMPANFSDTTAFQSIKEDLVPKGKPSEQDKISTKMESFLLKPCDSGVTHGFDLKAIEASDLNRKKIHAFNINGEPDSTSELHSSQASPSTVCQNQTKDQKIEETEKGGVSDINLPCKPGLGDQVTAGETLTKNEPEREHKGVGGVIDLNVCMNEDENMQIETDLQPPVSPENKESSPPRGESDENQLEMPYRLAGHECSELQEDEVKTAAEALVSISAFVGHNGLQMITCPPSESFVNSPLYWFARITSSVIDHSENDIKADFTGNTNEHEEFLSAGIDYFEAMTLKLTETKVLDCCVKSSGQNEEDSQSTSPTQPRKGWTNRVRRRKDFQSEILPCLTSLSRYEVTEDLQTIGGLMEAAGTHSERGSLRGAGRNALTRGRRRSWASASNNTDLLLKQQQQQQLSSDTKLGIEKSCLISWGKINRKPRGKRYPARNPKGFLSQVYN